MDSSHMFKEDDLIPVENYLTVKAADIFNDCFEVSQTEDMKAFDSLMELLKTDTEGKDLYRVIAVLTYIAVSLIHFYDMNVLEHGKPKESERSTLFARRLKLFGDEYDG